MVINVEHVSDRAIPVACVAQTVFIFIEPVRLSKHRQLANNNYYHIYQFHSTFDFNGKLHAEKLQCREQ